MSVDSGSFEYVPDEHKTYELCLAAAQHSGSSVKNLPEEYYSEELCLAIVQHSSANFDTIPKNKLTEKVCLLAISHGSRYGGTILSKIPHELITQEMCDKAIEKSIWSLEGVPEKFVTKEILMHVAAVAPGRLSDNFPERFRTKEFISEIVSRYPSAERYVCGFLNK